MDYLMQSAPGARTLINDRWRDYFSGCGYLGLQGHPALLAAASGALEQYGLTTGTSRGGYGEHPVFHHVESVAADFFETEAASYFVSGFLGNAVLLQSLRDDFEQIFVDEQSHYSVWSGAQIADVPVTSFRHRDAQDLNACCRRNLKGGERPLVISDGVFPISGEIAPVPDYVEVLNSYNGAILCLDDAHATGVLGHKGQGILEYYGLEGARRYATHTLSKALASHGGLIAGSSTLIERIGRNSTVPGAASPAPLPVAAAASRALELVKNDPSLREKLWANVAYAKDGLRALGWSISDTPVPIICLGARPGIDIEKLQSALFDLDICVAHVTKYSSTPVGGAIRIAIFATHTTEQIDRLIESIGEYS